MGEEEIREWDSNMEIHAKIWDMDTVRSFSELWSNTVVTTNGVFDIIHAGHVRYLMKAKSMGDYLIVLLNSDTSARRLKGPNRPFLSAFFRATVLAALECVDLVLVFDQKAPCDALRKLIRARVVPRYHVKGMDYANKEIPERKIIEDAGGEIILVDSNLDLSTSGIIETIRQPMIEKGLLT